MEIGIEIAIGKLKRTSENPPTVAIVSLFVSVKTERETLAV